MIHIHTFLCRKVPSTLVYIMQWVHSLCALVSQHKTGEKWITWATQYLINFTWRTQWFDFLWPPFLLQHRRIAPNHMTWGHTDGGRWRPLVAGLPSLTWWYNWRLGFLDRWSVTSSTCWMGQRSVSGVYLWHWTVSCPAIQSARFFYIFKSMKSQGSEASWKREDTKPTKYFQCLYSVLSLSLL